MYSMPRDLMTSIMKSDPLRSVVSTSTGGGVPTSASGDIGGGALVRGVVVGGAATAFGVATSAAAPTAAFFRKSRRLTDILLDLAMDGLGRHILYHTNCVAATLRD